MPELTIAETAKHLNISANAVRQRIKRGTLKATKRNGSVLVVTDQGNDQTTGKQYNTATHTDQPQPTHDQPTDQSKEIEALRKVVELQKQLISDLQQNNVTYKQQTANQIESLEKDKVWLQGQQTELHELLSREQVLRQQDQSLIQQMQDQTALPAVSEEEVSKKKSWLQRLLA